MVWSSQNEEIAKFEEALLRFPRAPLPRSTFMMRFLKWERRSYPCLPLIFLNRIFLWFLSFNGGFYSNLQQFPAAQTPILILQAFLMPRLAQFSVSRKASSLDFATNDD